MQSPDPLVSIITPSFNQGRFIEETILSVKNQNYPHIEHIIVDGGSTDETLDVIRRYEGTYNLRWVSEPDEGQADALNKGFRRARGEILAWLNADDIYLPGAIRQAADYLLAHPEVGMIYGSGYHIDEHGRRLPEPCYYSWPFNLKTLCRYDYILQPSTFFRREVLAEVGLLDVNLHWCLDWDLWIRIGQRFPVHAVPYRFSSSRVYPESKTQSGGAARMCEVVRVSRKYGSLLNPELAWYSLKGLNLQFQVWAKRYLPRQIAVPVMAFSREVEKLAIRLFWQYS